MIPLKRLHEIDRQREQDGQMTLSLFLSLLIQFVFMTVGVLCAGSSIIGWLF